MTVPLPTRLTAPALLAALLLVPTPAGARTTDLVLKDPKGDTEGLAKVSAEQRRTVDMRTAGYDGDADRLVVRVRFVDLRKGVPGNQFLDTRFTHDDAWIVASGEIGSKVVMMFDGTHYYECEGSKATADLDDDVVVQRIPTDCLAGFESSQGRTTSWLSKDNGSPILRDDVKKIAVSLD